MSVLSSFPYHPFCPFFQGQAARVPKGVEGERKRQVFSAQGSWELVRVKDEKTRSKSPHWELTQPTLTLRLAGLDGAACEVNLGGRDIGGLRRASEDGRV